MNQLVAKGCRAGKVSIPASKSVAHRLLIAAALSEAKSELRCEGTSDDIQATVNCLRALGAEVTEKTASVLEISPITGENGELRELPCGESGSTLRFLLPVAAALGRSVRFLPKGRLAERPMTALYEALAQHGVNVRQAPEGIFCSGRLTGGTFTIPGNISSQYISGLLFALPLLDADSRLIVTGRLESSAYVTLTEQALRCAGILFEKNGAEYLIPGGQHFRMPWEARVEGDWSNGAFFLCMGALSPKGITVSGLDPDSSQGDKKILELLKEFGAEITVSGNEFFVRKGTAHPLTVDAAEIPDLVPVLSVLLAGARGTSVIRNAERLRLKESDRLKTTAELILSLGGSAEETPDGLRIVGSGALTGGTIDAYNDHRIAMSAAAAASLCSSEVNVTGAECTAKSFPTFWEVLNSMEVLA